ncbi:TMEM175 family protein [Marinicella sp. S1101]|uniref:TMEM175 family protein n=1 Tax=Marinicella marina TaxID=2996016 RepID=UPI002260DE1C|nr:TMEM175 family protein [Marinicella marina]MCX7554056.1 TMEM175 family protein [Marinicella marina]MDJ1140548.1 TMEM175 family protein [Marinicella marina]
MQPLSDEFLAQCPVEDNFRMRGVEMTRIEVFVDAAFAFAVTMLVISIDQIPSSVPELLDISKLIPGFVLSVMQIIFIWHAHNKWSRKFGLDDGITVLLSATLVVVVLIFIYPLKMMFQGLFSWLTDGYLPSEFSLQTFDELRWLFQYFAAGFFMIGFIFMGFYAHAIRRKAPLKLSAEETFSAKTELFMRLDIMLVCVLAFLLPGWVADEHVPYTGFTYALLGPTSFLIYHWRDKKWQQLKSDTP